MRRLAIFAFMAVVGCGGSGASGQQRPAAPPSSEARNAPVLPARAPETAFATEAQDVGSAAEPADRPAAATWIGASAQSEALLAGTAETFLGVWVDVPNVRPTARVPVDLALVIDTSGSMGGAKIESARAAASQLVRQLDDGDIVSIDTFSDRAEVLAPPTVLTPDARERLLSAIARLRPHGSTNLFDGLSLGEAHVGQAPPSHSVRRVVVVSDGIANVGPSTPDALGAVAERGLRFRAQVTSLGVGTDYDEHTLNALAIRSSGRLFHVSHPGEMASFLDQEVKLLHATVASDAHVEIVPAPGVRLSGTEGVRAEWQPSGALQIPLGALYAGQHREALVRVRMDPARFEGAVGRPLASVRLVFHDPSDGDVERVQETVARVSTTTDSSVVLARANARANAIAAVNEAAKLRMNAAQAVSRGQFVDADKDLAAAEQRVVAQARATGDDAQKKRLEATAQSIAETRRAASAAAAAPKPAQRDEALKMNKAGMADIGY